MTLLDRIERLQQAECGSRELDEEIARLLGWTFTKMKGDAKPYWRKPGVTEWFRRSHEGPPHFTTSIDAAVTLFPPGRYWTVGTENGGWAWDGGGRNNPVYAKTPALAVCVAALMAREEAERD